MTTLLELRERVISIYSQYENYINMGAKFLIVLSGLVCINGQIGYQETLAGTLPTFLLALICTLLSPNLIVAVFGVVILAHLYSLALEAAVVGAILLLVALLVYYRFAPRDSMLLLLFPICRTIGIPYALPIAGGLLYSPASGAAVAVGVIADSFIRFIHQNETVISSASGSDTNEIVSRLQFLLDGIVQNHGMMIRAIAVVAAAAVVYLIRRLPIQYSWMIASGAGALCQILILLIGAMAYDTDIRVVGVLLGSIVGFGVGVVISFFMFNLDYTRIENTQFEDDDYYYYVKAIPKNIYARPKRTVKTINTRRGTQNYSGGGRETADSYYPGSEDGYAPLPYGNGSEEMPENEYESAGGDASVTQHYEDDEYEYAGEQEPSEDGYAGGQDGYPDDFREDF